MTRSNLDDAGWASLMLSIQGLPQVWKRDEAGLRHFVKAVLWIGQTGAPWRDLPVSLGHWSSVYHRWRRWCRRGWWARLFERLRPARPADGLLLIDSTTCKANRAAAGAAGSTAEAEALGRSREGLGTKLYAAVDGDQACAAAADQPRPAFGPALCPLAADRSARHQPAADRGYVSAQLREEFARHGRTLDIPPKRDMIDPPAWDRALYTKPHLVEMA